MPVWLAMTILILIGVLVLAAIVFTGAMCMSAFFADAPWVPLSRRGIAVVLELIGDLPRGAVVIDLGSGDGRVLRAIVRRNPHVRGIGVERSYVLTWFARRWSRLRGFSQLEFIRENFHHVALGDADIVTTYLWPEVMGTLREKFTRELVPGARVISAAFAIPTWSPTRSRYVRGIGLCYEYHMPH